MVRPWVFVISALAFALAGCSAGGDSGDPDPSDASLVLDKQRAPSPQVENGTAYDRASVDLGAAKTVVVPDTATVRRSDAGGPVRLFMAKQLSFGGHPAEPMSIREVRKHMGCAVKADGDALVIATFGEWDSHIEGGKYMKLVAVVPEGVPVERRAGLSGERSAGRDWQGLEPAPTAPGWTAVPDEPDPDRTAR